MKKLAESGGVPSFSPESTPIIHPDRYPEPTETVHICHDSWVADDSGWAEL